MDELTSRILVTEATTFVGRAVVRRLSAEGHPVRCLLRPSRRAQLLPQGVTCSVVSASPDSPPALRSALQDVQKVIHLAPGGSVDEESRFLRLPAETADLVQAMEDTGIKRIVYLSRLGADPASAYPFFRLLGEAEAIIRESGLDHTVLRPAVTYGPEDEFTNLLAMLAKAIPFVFPIPDPGLSRFQPLWIEDLTTCVAASLDRDDLVGRTLALGGPEHFSLEQMVDDVLGALGIGRTTLHVRLPLMLALSSVSSLLLPRNPVPPWMLDIVMLGSAADLGAIPRVFGTEPRGFSQGLGHLRRKRRWRLELLRFVLGRG